jgi:hypothetical protein
LGASRVDIKEASDEEVMAVIERVRREERQEIPLAQREAEIRLIDNLLSYKNQENN